MNYPLWERQTIYKSKNAWYWLLKRDNPYIWNSTQIAQTYHNFRVRSTYRSHVSHRQEPGSRPARPRYRAQSPPVSDWPSHTSPDDRAPPCLCVNVLPAGHQTAPSCQCCARLVCTARGVSLSPTQVHYPTLISSDDGKVGRPSSLNESTATTEQHLLPSSVVLHEWYGAHRDIFFPYMRKLIHFFIFTVHPRKIYCSLWQ